MKHEPGLLLEIFAFKEIIILQQINYTLKFCVISFFLKIAWKTTCFLRNLGSLQAGSWPAKASDLD